jgi:hypothetical protein
MHNDLKTLAIHHVGETSEDDARVAISPGQVKLVASRDIRLNGRDLKMVTIHFMDSEAFQFNISSIDLMNLENVIAGYSFRED